MDTKTNIGKTEGKSLGTNAINGHYTFERVDPWARLQNQEVKAAGLINNYLRSGKRLVQKG